MHLMLQHSSACKQQLIHLSQAHCGDRWLVIMWQTNTDDWLESAKYLEKNFTPVEFLFVQLHISHTLIGNSTDAFIVRSYHLITQTTVYGTVYLSTVQLVTL
jgi:hypothetical protein